LIVNIGKREGRQLWWVWGLSVQFGKWQPIASTILSELV